METAGAGEAPLKVCRHCSAASRTRAESCPNCGKPYSRGPRWRWWMVVPIVLLAFAVGFLGRMALQDDDETAESTAPPGLTIREARNLDVGVSPAKLQHVLDGQKPAKVRRQSAGGNELLCRYYVVVDLEDTFWESCYLNGRLEVSEPLKAGSD